MGTDGNGGELILQAIHGSNSEKLPERIVALMEEKVPTMLLFSARLLLMIISTVAPRCMVT